MKDDQSPVARWLSIISAIGFIAFIPLPVLARAQARSQTRIVRLSFVDGNVTLSRPDAVGWAKVGVNTPIQQGFKLATGANSFAEVEFENGSTARLGQYSQLDFADLSFSAEGEKINHLILASGYATFTVMPHLAGAYQVRADGSTYNASGNTMFRIDLGSSSQRLEVFKGDVQVQGPYGSGTVAHNQVLDLSPGRTDEFQITTGITEDAWDHWVNKRQKTEMVASRSSGSEYYSGPYAGSPFYGWSDLSYFGTWNFLPGYGSCWSPMMGAGWVPYSIGRWSWYQGFGYTWISGLSWGWLPFHYGSWIYPADVGWCWLPGSFSMWSPALVTWTQGPSWVSWSPMPASRTYRKPPGFRHPLRCPSGQNCSVAVSNNIFQRGRVISPVDAIRVNPFRGRSVGSPSLHVTRSLRLPGPAVDGPPPTYVTGATRRPGVRRHDVRAVAPARIFSESTFHGAWNVQPHAPAVFNPRTHRFVNGTGPALQFVRENHSHLPGTNHDVLLGGPGVRRRTGQHSGRVHGRLTPVPISSLGMQGDALRESRSLMPTVRRSGTASGMHTFHEPRMPDFHRSGFFGWFHSRGNARTNREMELNSRYGIAPQRAGRFPSARRSTGRFGRNMGQSRSSMQRGSFGRSMRSRNMGGGIRRGGFGGGMHSGSVGGGMRGHGMGGGMPGGGGMRGGVRSGGGGGAHGRH